MAGRGDKSMQMARDMNDVGGYANILGRVTRRLLGRILVDGEFISPRDLDQALTKQKETNKQLGDILVGMGVLDPVHLSIVLSLQNGLSSLPDAVKVASGVRQVLGELLVKAHQITRPQLNQALREQKQTGAKLGEILVGHGLLSLKGLDAILQFQKNQSSSADTSPNFRLGEILVASDYITREQLADALRKQKLSHRKIGTILVEEGYVTKRQVSKGLKLQSMLAMATVTAVLSLAVGPQHDLAYAQSATGRVHVSARVVARSHMKVLHQVSQVTITRTDIRRGFVEIGSGSRFEIRNNNPQGYVLSFHGIANPFKAVYVKAKGTDVYLEGTESFVQRPYVKGNEIVELSYRLILAEDVKPGIYPFPIAFSVQPA
jgi:hypothetical protein